MFSTTPIPCVPSSHQRHQRYRPPPLAVQINPKLDAGAGVYRRGRVPYPPRRHPGLEKYKDDKAVLQRLEEIKAENKRRFAAYLARESGVVLNTDAIFDVQVKRLHEYKRQLLNVLHIISLYQQLQDDPNMDFRPQTFLFRGQGRPGLRCGQAHYPPYQLPGRPDQQ